MQFPCVFSFLLAIAALRVDCLRSAAAPLQNCQAAAASGRWGDKQNSARRVALVFRGEIFRAEKHDEYVEGKELGYNLHRFTCTPEALERQKKWLAPKQFNFISELEGLGYAVDVLGTSSPCNGPRDFTPSYTVEDAISEIYGDRLRKLTMNKIQNSTQQASLLAAAQVALDYSAEQGIAYDYVLIMRWVHERDAGSWGCNMKNNPNAFQWPVNNCELGDHGSCDVFHIIPRKFFLCFEEFLRTVPIGVGGCCRGCRTDCQHCMGDFRKTFYQIDLPGNDKNSTVVPACPQKIQKRMFVPGDEEEWLNTRDIKDCPQ
jgi:hypothetical protein